MMTAITSAGSTLGISATLPGSFDATGFNAVTHTLIGEIVSIDGDIGRVYNGVTHNPLASRATVKKKGSYNSGSATIQLAIDNDDAGQVIAKAALNSDANYSFKLTLQNGDIIYFQGMVMSFPISVGGVDAITSGTITVEITAQDDGDDFVAV
jgi:hypothetical protein